jgi:hypothetical protein
MGASQIKICNLALSKIGGGVMVSLDEGSTAAAACKLIYDDVRDEVLQIRPWASCVKRGTLAKLDDGPPFEWTNAFQLPPDFLDLTRLGSDQNASPPYSIEGRTLLTNEGTAPVVYIFRNEDPMTYEPVLVDLIATRMAVDLAMSVAGNAALKAALSQEYEMKRQRAKAVDGQSTGQPNFTMTTWVEARL